MERWSDKYQVLTELGRGGMGSVVLARQTKPAGFDRLVVIKRIRVQLLDSGQAVRMFLEEARLTARLVHPNIVQIYDLGQEEGAPYLVLEHVHGRTLRQVQQALGERPLPVHHALTIAAALCRGLHFAHTFVDEHGREQRVVHRDVKPNNVLVAFSGGVKLIDFGVAKSAMSLVRTSTGVMKGTFAYMSPEQIRGDEGIDGRSDLFSLGIMIYEMLAGAHPFLLGQSENVLEAIQLERPPPLAEVRPDLPGAQLLQPIVDRCLAKEPDRRWSSARELELALERCNRRFAGTLVEQDDLTTLMASLFPDEVTFRLPGGVGDTEQGWPPPAEELSPTLPVLEEEVETVADLPEPEVVARPSPRLSVVDDIGSPTPAEPRRSRRPLLIVLVVVPVLMAVAGGALIWWAAQAPHEIALTRRAIDQRVGLPADGAATVAAQDAAVAPPDAAVSPPDAGSLHRRTRPRKKRAAAPPARQRPDAAPPQKVLGQLQVRTRPASVIRLGSSRGFGGARLPLLDESGVVQAGGGAAPFRLRLTYLLQGGSLLLTVASEPWAIAYPVGLRPGKTPRRGIPVGSTARRIDLRRPGGGEMTLIVRFVR